MTGTAPSAAVDAPQPLSESRSRPLLEIAAALAAVLVSMLAALWKVGGPSTLGGLWGHWDFTTAYAGAHTLARQFWLTPNYDFGFPFVQDLAHYPTPDYVHIVALKLLALITGDPLTAVNVFLIAGFGFVAVGAYALFRVLRFPMWVSFALAIAFSLLPWHFDRFIHAFLSNYASVPLGLIIVVAVTSWNLGIAGPDRGRARDIVLVLVLGICVGLSGAYYAVFVSILAVVTIAFQVLVGRRGRDLLPAIWLALVPLITTQAAAYVYRLLAVSPGPSTSAFGRSPEESQLFGGAIFTLVRTTGIWSEGLTVPGLQYVSTLNSGLEADAANSSVGLVAVVLSFVVCAMILVRNGRYRGGAWVERFGYWPWMFLVGVFFFAAGGFGQAFSVFFLFQIRSWGRFAIVVLAVAFVILGILLTWWVGRSRRPRAVTGIVVAGVLAFTALDIATMAPPIDATVANREGDELRDLGRQIDAAVPDGCGIFELPAYSYPEGVPADGTPTYEPMLPSLFSEHARWSYGGIRGTQAGTWSVADVSHDIPTLVQQTAAAGFCGILVDTAAYGDDSPVPPFQAALGDPVATSTSGRWQLFSLAEAAPGQLTRDYVLNPVRVSFGFGFTPAESERRLSATIDEDRAALFIENPRAEEMVGTVTFEADAMGCPAAPSVAASTTVGTSSTDLGAGEVTVQVPATVSAGGVAAVHLRVDPACSSDDGTTGVQIINPRFTPSS